MLVDSIPPLHPGSRQDLFQMDEQVWAIHGYIPVDGEVILAEFERRDRNGRSRRACAQEDLPNFVTAPSDPRDDGRCLSATPNHVRLKVLKACMDPTGLNDRALVERYNALRARTSPHLRHGEAPGAAQGTSEPAANASGGILTAPLRS